MWCVCVCVRARVVLASTYIPREVSLEFWQAASGRDGPLRLQRCQYRHEIHIQLATRSEPHKVVRTKMPAAESRNNLAVILRSRCHMRIKKVALAASAGIGLKT